MPALEVARYPRLATPAEAVRCLAGGAEHYEWPPRGTTSVVWAFPELWPIIYGEPTIGKDGDWWVTSLAEATYGIDGDLASFLAGFGSIVNGPLAWFASVTSSWPVIYEQGSGDIMRWIRSTFRGELGGGVEQFQWKIDWGKPGADPTFTEAQSLAFADLLSSEFAELWAPEGPTTLCGRHSNQVAYKEVGVTMLTQTDGTAADGSGGNLEQAFENQWHLYVGAGLVGTKVTPSLPYEVACAVTLQTDHRGPSGRGRLYMPPFDTGAMAAGGLFSSAYTGQAADTIGALFDAIKVAEDLVPVVVSRRRIILNEITSVNVGLVPDSQRRRRRSQDEARVIGWTAA